jgi:hypothetical protein
LRIKAFVGGAVVRVQEVGVKDLADFVGWLRNPFESGKVTPLQQIEAKRTEKSVNLRMAIEYV